MDGMSYHACTSKEGIIYMEVTHSPQFLYIGMPALYTDKQDSACHTLALPEGPLGLRPHYQSREADYKSSPPTD